MMSTKKVQPRIITANKKSQPVDWETLLVGFAGVKTVVAYGPNRNIFAQGEPADAVFFLRQGKVRLAVTSKQGREAAVANLGAGEFFGEGCLAGQRLRIGSATAITLCSVARIEKQLMARMLHERRDVSELFVTHLLSRNIRYEADLVDLLFNSSEKRLARALLLLAHFGRESKAKTVVPKVSQKSLAKMIGTTISRVSHFMNKFKDLGFVDYNGDGGLTVNSALLTVLLRD